MNFARELNVKSPTLYDGTEGSMETKHSGTARRLVLLNKYIVIWTSDLFGVVFELSILG